MAIDRKKKPRRKKIESRKEREERLEREAAARKAEYEAFEAIDDQVKDTRVAGINGRTLTGLLVGALGLFMEPESPERKRLVRMSGSLLSVGLTEHVVDRIEEGRPLVERRNKDGEWEAHPGFPRANGLPIPQDPAPKGFTLGELFAEAATGEDASELRRRRPKPVQNKPPEAAEAVDAPNAPVELDTDGEDPQEDDSTDNG